MSCAFSHDDAAFVLGALSPQDRRKYEEHLTTCRECSRDVQAIAGLPGLLGKVSIADLTATPDVEAPPQSLLPSLLSRVRRERRRRGWVGAGLAAAAACLVAASLGVFIAQGGDAPPADGTTSTAAVLAMTPIGDAPIRATAQLVDKPWGTSIDVRCKYISHYGAESASYALVVIDRSGGVQQVATWKAVTDGEAQVTGSSSWTRNDIAAIEIRTESGTAVTRLVT
jgi:hypothetical protein